MSDTVRIKLLFSGHVQGVGFRATTANIARGFNVAGHVKNLPDGQVECVAEGERDEVKRFRKEVESRMSGFIRDVAASDEPPRHDADFKITH